MEAVKTKIVSLLILIIFSSCTNTVKTEKDSQTYNLEREQIEQVPEYKNQEQSVSNLRTIRENYSDSLLAMIEMWSSDLIPRQDMILFCLPTTNHEALEFYNLDYSDDNDIRVAFSKMNSFIERKCSEGDTTYLRRYFMLSEFVDGYFAEVYFTNVKVYIEKYTKYFCEIYPQIDSTTVKRLYELYKEKCVQ